MKHDQKDPSRSSANEHSFWIQFPDGSTRGSDFQEIELVLKNIRFIRHELTQHQYLYASQLSFAGHLYMNYWEYLKLQGACGQQLRDELEEGSLLVIYLLYAEIFEGEGWCYLYRTDLFDTVHSFLHSYTPDNEKKKELKARIQFSMDQDENSKFTTPFHDDLEPGNKELRERSIANDAWVYKTFVKDYFVDIANSFEAMRKKTKDLFDPFGKNGGN